MSHQKATTANEQLREKIKGIRIAMLTTIDEDGSLHSRPMATQETESDGDLWFFTAAGSTKAGEVERDQRVNLSYADPDDQRYVSWDSPSSKMVQLAGFLKAVTTGKRYEPDPGEHEKIELAGSSPTRSRSN